MELLINSSISLPFKLILLDLLGNNSMGRYGPSSHSSQLFFGGQKTGVPKMKIEKIYVDSEHKDKQSNCGKAHTDDF